MLDSLRQKLAVRAVWPFASSAPAERRRDARFSDPPLTLKIEGQRYKTVDWSLGGCKIAGFARPLGYGDRVSGAIVGIRSGGSGEFVAEVIHVSEEFGIGLRWIEIARTTFHALRPIRYPSLR